MNNNTTEYKNILYEKSNFLFFRIYDNPLFNSIRSRDIEALCSDRMKKWIRDNKVELVNYRDAIFGTREYQNHLKATGSDLAV